MPSTFGIVASGEDVLNDAVFWVDAGRSSVSGGALTNLGTGGSALNAVFGNTTGVDTFDPALLTHTGTNYLYLPGVTGNYASTPSSTALNITGDIEIVVRMQCADWTPTATGQIICKDAVSAGNRSWGLDLLSNGGLRWISSADGTNVNVNVVTSTFPGSTVLVDGQSYWLKITHDVDNGASGNDVRWFYAADQASEPSSWTQIGTTRTTAGITSIANTSVVVSLGDRTVSASPLQMSLYRCIIRNGIGGTTVFDADFTTGITSGSQTTFTESSANAATVTINRATSGRKSVAVVRPILLFGTDDYLEVADNDLLDFGASDSFTVVALARNWTTPVSFRPYLQKAASIAGFASGYSLYSNPGNTVAGYVADGVNRQFSNVPTYTYGQLTCRTLVVNRSSNTMTAWNNSAPTASNSTSSVGSLVNTNALQIGNSQDFELVAAAVWRRALNANEIATIVNRYT